VNHGELFASTASHCRDGNYGPGRARLQILDAPYTAQIFTSHYQEQT
jgi:hypothetical protein